MEDAYEKLDNFYNSISKNHPEIIPIYRITGSNKEGYLVKLVSGSSLSLVKEEFEEIKSARLFSLQSKIPADRSLITTFVLHAKDEFESKPKKIEPEVKAAIKETKVPAVKPTEPKRQSSLMNFFKK